MNGTQPMDTNMDNNSTLSVTPRSTVLEFSQSFMFFSLAGIIPTGLVFNTASILVFCSRTMRKRSATLYLASLAISDDLSLVAVTFDYWLKNPRVDMPIIKQSQGVCIAITHLSYASRMFSALLITSFTIERFICVVFPLKRATLSSVYHARRVVISEGVLSILATSFTIFTIRVVDAPYGLECDVRPDKYKIYFYLNVIFLVFGSIVIPILVICSLNTFILRKICTRRANLVCSKHFSRRTRQGYNTATVLLAVSSAFVVLNLPYCVSWFLLFFHHYGFIPSLGEHATSKLFAAKFITSVPYYLNYSINFLLYNICARTFRQELGRLLCMPYQVCRLRSLSRKRSSPSGGTKPTYLQDSSRVHGPQVCTQLTMGRQCTAYLCDNGKVKSSVTL